MFRPHRALPARNLTTLEVFGPRTQTHGRNSEISGMAELGQTIGDLYVGLVVELYTQQLK